MRVFLEKTFSRWARKEKLDHDVLCKAAREASAGQFDADLGGYLFKKRIARKGKGKSGGYRAILGFRKENSERVFFLYGFPKSARANISSREQLALGIVAESLMNSSDGQIEELIALGRVFELECEDE